MNHPTLWGQSSSATGQGHRARRQYLARPVVNLFTLRLEWPPPNAPAIFSPPLSWSRTDDTATARCRLCGTSSTGCRRDKASAARQALTAHSRQNRKVGLAIAEHKHHPALLIDTNPVAQLARTGGGLQSPVDGAIFNQHRAGLHRIADGGRGFVRRQRHDFRPAVFHREYAAGADKKFPPPAERFTGVSRLPSSIYSPSGA